MKKCPVCAVEVEDNAPFCNICGVNLAGAKDVGPSKIETPVAEDSGKVTSTSVPPSLASSRPSFYLPAIQFLLAVALLGLVLYYTTGEVPRPGYVYDDGKPTEENLDAYINMGAIHELFNRYEEAIHNFQSAFFFLK